MEEEDDSCLFGLNLGFVEGLYARYVQGDVSIAPDWLRFFSQRDKKGTPKSLSGGTENAAVEVSVANVRYDLYTKVMQLINFFRSHAHIAANLDPLGLTEVKQLDYHDYCDLQPSDLQLTIQLSGMFNLNQAKIQDLIQILTKIYCDNIGFEFMHISSHEERLWLQQQIESLRPKLHNEEKLRILQDLIESEGFEQFLHIKYPGYKRFSVEGAESLIVALESIIGEALLADIDEIVFGMAHRGRLNVLTKVLGKKYAAMLSEFQGKLAFPADLDVCGDVKYHLGYTATRTAAGDKKIRLSLCSNPSHLEAVNPVVMGKVRAIQDAYDQNKCSSTMALMIHGDASFAGQGVVAETLTLSNLTGYSVSGAVHIIVNNQIGFTANPESTKSSRYCSDLAKFIEAPVFHVNGDDPEAVVFIMKLALNYRNKFNKDVFVDLVCYRRHGHNEGDEPLFTQPVMYKVISKHKTTLSLYAEKLQSEGVLSNEEFVTKKKQFRDTLEQSLLDSANYKPSSPDWFADRWQGLHRPQPGNFADYCTETGISGEDLQKLAAAANNIPEGFDVNNKVKKLLAAREQCVRNGSGIDWGTAESLSLASLLVAGYPVRLSGQDCGRGTFSHRHARLTDQATGKTHVPLNYLRADQQKFEVVDSALSEYAVMGFEYGFASGAPNALVIWEGQFGDFANGAQIVIDQFVSSAETKWLRASGLVLLLPHGYEGQGPEHSSARIERFLQLCAEDNMQVVNCSTPANYFHVLRRQLCRNFRKPLIVFTPKSLLRHKLAVSEIADFSGGFRSVIADNSAIKADNINRVVICSGKIYYDLLEHKINKKADYVAIVRLEQFYPFPAEQLKAELQKYSNAEVIWCQEEPQNMGGWFFVSNYIEEVLLNSTLKCKRPRVISRPASASPSSGYSSVHVAQQQSILNSIFGS